MPGVTSATAAAVLAGVPLTSTGGAAGFSVVSGHLPPDHPDNRVDWTSLARSGTNLVVLMGRRQLPAITARLIADGVSPDATATCVADASLPSQRVVRAPLRELAQAVAGAGLSMAGRQRVRAPEELRFARSCYDHLAGALGVAVGERAIALRLMREDGAATPAGVAFLEGLGRGAPKGCARRCLDWTERRDHWAGGFASALFDGLIERRVLNRVEGSRGLAVTPLGAQWLKEKLGLDLGLVRAA